MRKIFFDDFDFDFDFENYQRSNNQNRFRGIFLLAEQKENIERECGSVSSVNSRAFAAKSSCEISKFQLRARV